MPKRLMAFCPNCGKAFSEVDHFCAGCGAAREPISAVANSPAQQPALATRATSTRSKPWGVYPQSGAGWIGFVLGGVVGLGLAIFLLAPGGPAVAATTFGCALIGGGIADALLGRPNRRWTIGTGAAALVVAVILAAFGVGIPTRSSTLPVSQIAPTFVTDPGIANVRVSAQNTVTFEMTPQCPDSLKLTGFLVKLLDDSESVPSVVGGRIIPTGPYPPNPPGVTFVKGPTVTLYLSELSHVDSTHHRIELGEACSQ